MSNIHNNSVLQSVSNNRGLKAGEAQNESNGLGSSGYFQVFGEEKQEQDDRYVDRSDYLMSALSGLATLNSSRFYVKRNIMKKMAAKTTEETAA